jgi:hypothetical protein
MQIIMPRDTHAEPIIEDAIDAPPYRELLAPAYCDDVFKPIPPRTPAARRFAQAATLAEVLRLALDDLTAILGDPRYAIDLNSWHRPADGQCTVCLAGSVIAKSLAAPIDLNLAYDDYVQPIADRLGALDSLRQGQVRDALVYIGGDSQRLAAEELALRYRPALQQFAVDPLISHERAALFLDVMWAMQRELQEAGL